MLQLKELKYKYEVYIFVITLQHILHYCKILISC